ncbi:MAG: hypothetical protein E7580_03045 [Ruminococcaceae bacterium]|nr:hypothetical protein [Oscillospiraceae bacterium]
MQKKAKSKQVLRIRSAVLLDKTVKKSDNRAKGRETMNTLDAIEKRRSIRKFKPIPVPNKVLYELVRLGRLYSSAMNGQPIRFAVVTQKEDRDFLFKNLNWAMRLHPYPIAESERPMAYVLLLGKNRENDFFEFDAGSCASTLMLAAESFGIANCCLKITKREEIRSHFSFGDLLPYYAIALGYAGVGSKAVESKGDLSYYLNENGDFRVPKRSVEEVLVYNDTNE